VADLNDVDALSRSLLPIVSVVIPVRNGMPWLEDQLRAVADQKLTAEWELVVADNGSEDGTRACVQRWSERDPRIRLVEAAHPVGPGAARNVGVNASTGSLLVFCDADDIVQPDWLDHIVAALADNDVVSGVYDFRATERGTEYAPIPAATSQMGFLPFGLGANLAVRREAFQAVSGFRENFLVGEDIDLCWRLQLAGYRFAVEQAAVVRKRETVDEWSRLRKAWSYGKCGAVLYRQYRTVGMRPNLRAATKSWLWLLLNVPRLFERHVRRQWLRTLAVRTGRLAGSVTQHGFFP
jgi:cellulose synthase/poly-beta-1,6-N-acetylglucosamine synthase-like glycosyltransferase